jgi:type IV secretory pathway TrbD component
VIDDDRVHTPVDLSLTRPVLLWGADRRYAGGTFIIAAAMVFGAGPSTLSVTLAAFLLAVVLPLLALAEATQSGFWSVAPRYFMQQVYYPARASHHARGPWRLPTRMR